MTPWQLETGEAIWRARSLRVSGSCLAAKASKMSSVRLAVFTASMATRALALAPFLLFHGFFLDLVEPVEAHERLDLLARLDALLRREAGVAAGALDLLVGTLGEVEACEQVGEGVDRRLVAHVGELRAARQRAAVAVTAADDVDQRDLALL